MSLLAKAITGAVALFRSQPNATLTLFDTIKSVADEVFTSDEERQKFHNKMEELAQSSKSLMAQTGRAALMWSVSIVVVYQVVIRDVLASFFNVPLAETGFEIEWLLETVFELLGGTL
jgi:hypothetical protein